NTQGKYAEAEVLYQKALAICRQTYGDDHPDTATTYHNLAYNLHVQGKDAEALAQAQAACRTYEAVRLAAVGRPLDRALFEVDHSPYRLQAPLLARAGRAADAWAALEADLARSFLDESALRRGASLTPQEQRLRQHLSERLGQLQPRFLNLVIRSADPQFTPA